MSRAEHREIAAEQARLSSVVDFACYQRGCENDLGSALATGACHDQGFDPRRALDAAWARWLLSDGRATETQRDFGLAGGLKSVLLGQADGR
jgi:hypothetical protein